MAEMVGIRDAVSGWRVSERALRRRLTTGEVEEASRSNDGSWRVSAEWLDQEFDRNVIDLRDPVVSDGLAAMLAELSDLTQQTRQAEVRAAVAEKDLEQTNRTLRTVNDQLEAEKAELDRSQHDYRELEKEHAVQAERLRVAEAEADRAWATWEQAEAQASQQQLDAQHRIDELKKQTTETERRLRMVESMIGRRKRKAYLRMVEGLGSKADLR